VRADKSEVGVWTDDAGVGIRATDVAISKAGEGKVCAGLDTLSVDLAGSVCTRTGT
jgi:hypothetical protein